MRVGSSRPYQNAACKHVYMVSPVHPDRFPRHPIGWSSIGTGPLGAFSDRDGDIAANVRSTCVCVCVNVCVYANTETLALGIGRFGSDLIEVEKHNINHLILFRAAVPSSCVSVSSVSLCPIHNMERGRIQTGRFVCVCDTRKGSG